jgi:phenylacetate-CoA ligase
LGRILCGSEILSSSLADSARALFGIPVVDGYGQTETAPLSAQVCSSGHLHFDTHAAYVEVLALSGDRSAGPGELGTLVVTPYYPFRHTMPLIRYQTDDVVRVLAADEPLSCELAALPATSPIEGRRQDLMFVGEHVVTRRDLVQAIESLPTRPYPARYFAEGATQGLVISLQAAAVNGISCADVRAHLQEMGLPVVRVRVWPEEFSFHHLCPLRADATTEAMRGRASTASTSRKGG